VRVASDVPAAQRTPLEVLRTESGVFRAVLDQRRNRHEAWFKFNPGHIDVCNVPLPVRRAPAGG
jgi:peptidylprolyl isomerase